MAEAFLNKFAPNKFIAESAGIEPGSLNPCVVQVMQEIGIDISNNTIDSVKDFIEQGKNFDFIITVCDQASAEKCPIFPGSGKRLHFGFEDPSSIETTQEEKLIKICKCIKEVFIILVCKMRLMLQNLF